MRVYPDTDSRPYLISPTIDAGAIQRFTRSNLAGPLFVLNESASLGNEIEHDVGIKEAVSAAYAMANLQFGKFQLTPGLRFEHTRERVSGFRLDDGDIVVPVTGSNSYNDLLPSIIARLDPTDKIVLRAAYTRSLGRPEYADLSPRGELQFEESSIPGQFEGQLSSGNPDLKPYRSDNFDLSAEYYFARGGLIAIAAFAKRIANPIFSQTIARTGVTFDGRLFERLEATSPFNADRGNIVGIEASYQQQFTFLPGLLAGFGIQLTGTLVDSRLRLPDGRKVSFPAQSNYLYGAELFYQRGRFEASIAYHNTGHSLLEVGGEPFEDQYNDDLRRLDAKASFAVTPFANLFFEAQNLTDEPTRQYQGGRHDWVTQNERYGRTFYAGVSAKF